MKIFKGKNKWITLFILGLLLFYPAHLLIRQLNLENTQLSSIPVGFLGGLIGICFFKIIRYSSNPALEKQDKIDSKDERNKAIWYRASYYVVNVMCILLLITGIIFGVIGNMLFVLIFDGLSFLMLFLFLIFIAYLKKKM